MRRGWSSWRGHGAWGHGGLGVGDLKGSLFEIPERWEKLVLPSTS